MSYDRFCCTVLRRDVSITRPSIHTALLATEDVRARSNPAAAQQLCKTRRPGPPGPPRQKNNEMLSLAVVAGALPLSLGSAAPPPAPARGGIKLSSCPKGGSSPPRRTTDSEAGIETICSGDYEITTSYENGSTCGAQAGENGLDGAFPQRALASTDARGVVAPALQKLRGRLRRRVRLRDYTWRGECRARPEQVPGGRGARAPRHRADRRQRRAIRELPVRRHHIDVGGPDAKGGVDVLDVASAELAPTPGTTMQFKGGVDEEEAAQSYLGRTSWCLFQVLASVVPRRSSSAMGAAWRSSIVGYLLIWGTPPAWRRRLRSAAAAAAATTTPSPKPRRGPQPSRASREASHSGVRSRAM